MLDWKRECFNGRPLMSDEEAFSVCTNRSDDILSLKFFSDEVGFAVDLDSPLNINLPDEGDPAPGNRQCKMPLFVDERSKTKVLWYVPECWPENISEDSGEPRSVFALYERPMWLFVMIVPKKPFGCFPEYDNATALMASQNPLLPEVIEALHRGVSARFSLRDEDNVDTKEQVESDESGDAVGVASSTCSRHLVVKLRCPRNSDTSPCLLKMSTQGDGLFVSELTAMGCVPCNIHGMEGIKPRDSLRASEVAGSDKVGLMEIPHPISSEPWIGFFDRGLLRRGLRSPTVTGKDTSDGADARNALASSLGEFPVDDLRTNSRKNRTSRPVTLQFIPERENLLDHLLWGLPMDVLGRSASFSEPFNPTFLISPEPFSKPVLASPDNPPDFTESVSPLIKVYCLTSFLVFIIAFHRLLLPPPYGGNSVWRCLLY